MITEKDVLKIASLANLELFESEIKKFSVQLSSILDYVKKLEEVDTNAVLPTSHPISETKNRFQDDDNTVDRTLSTQDVLKNASKTKGGYAVTEGVFK